MELCHITLHCSNLLVFLLAIVMSCTSNSGYTSFLMGASRHDHISLVLHSLHWLPVKQRVDTSWLLSSTSRLSSIVPVKCRRLPANRGLQDAPSLALLTPTSSLFREQTLDLAIGVSRLRVREFGTVYPPQCGSLTLNLDTLNDF